MISNIMSRGMFKRGGVSVVLSVNVETCIGSYWYSIVMVAILKRDPERQERSCTNKERNEKLAFFARETRALKFKYRNINPLRTFTHLILPQHNTLYVGSWPMKCGCQLKLLTLVLGL